MYKIWFWWNGVGKCVKLVVGCCVCFVMEDVVVFGEFVIEWYVGEMCVDNGNFVMIGWKGGGSVIGWIGIEVCFDFDVDVLMEFGGN